jgi:hypothetical protein
MRMVKLMALATLLLAANSLKAQKVDSIFFNLYTDSLKKGVHNYINVDGKLSNGRWMPLTTKELNFSASTGRFDGNSLIIDTSFSGEKVVVTAVLKSNPVIKKEVIIYIKKLPNNEALKTSDELLNEMKQPRKQKRG